MVPFGRNLVFVFDGAAGIIQKEATGGQVRPLSETRLLTPNEECEQAFKKEHPTPSRIPEDTSHLKQSSTQEGGDNFGKRIDSVENSEPDRQVVLVVPIRKVQNIVRDESTLECSAERHQHPYLIVAVTHIRKRVAKKNARPLSQNWAPDRTEKMTICIGIHLSGPSRLDTSWDGSSAQRKPSFDNVFPRL
jgi:hypothetical protein